MGKIVGESLVAFVQGIGIIGFGFLIGIDFTVTQLLGLLVMGVAVCFVGGAFGVIVLANIDSQRAANQIFSRLLCCLNIFSGWSIHTDCCLALVFGHPLADFPDAIRCRYHPQYLLHRPCR